MSDITLDYVSSIYEDREIIPYDVTGSQAHVVMLYDTGIIPRDDAAKILDALQNCKAEDLDNSNAEDIHEAIEARIISEAGMQSGGRMHTARSRNDQVAVDIRMKIRDDINRICGQVLDTAEVLVSIAQSHRRTVMPLYTHLQHAQVGTFSHYLLAHADALLRDYGRLSDCYARVNQSPLGAGPVGGTSIKIDRDSTARMLGFSGLVENSIDATSTRDFMAEYVASLAIMMSGLSKMAEDFAIWSSSEFSFVELADEFASPSSVMPQKKNPDIMEIARSKSAQTIGDLAGILCTIKGLATGYGRDLQQAKVPAWQASKTASSTLTVLKTALMTMKVNEKNMKKAAGSGYLMAMDIAERLVQEGVPFRDAHSMVGRLVGDAHDQNKRLVQIGDDAIISATQNTKVSPHVVSDIIKSSTISSSLRGRMSRGSSGFAEQKRMIKDRAKRIQGHRTELTRRRDGVSCALAELRGRVNEIVGRRDQARIR